MKPQDIPDAQAIARLIENGSATRRDWVAFLIYIRDSIPEGMVRDLGHFVAHTKRDRFRGYTYAFVEAFAERMFTGLLNGEIVQVLPVLETSALVEELCRNADTVGIVLNAAAVMAHRAAMEATLAEVLDGSSILLKHPDTGSCELSLERIQNLDGSQEIALMCMLRAEHNLEGSAMTIAAGDGRAFKVFG